MKFPSVTMSEKYACIIGKQNWYAFMFITAGKSFMYRRNRKGPNIEPWGVACLIIAQFENVVL